VRSTSPGERLRDRPAALQNAPMSSTRLRANVLLAAAAWTLYVWVTRIWNILQDPAHPAGFKVVHSLLALVSVAFGVALLVIGWRMRRESRRD
jgi:small neutral amino acid transporter SnatA (MarC family)